MSDKKTVEKTEKVLCRRKFKDEDGVLIEADTVTSITKSLYAKLSKNGVVTKDLP